MMLTLAAQPNTSTRGFRSHLNSGAVKGEVPVGVRWEAQLNRSTRGLPRWHTVAVKGEVPVDPV